QLVRTAHEALEFRAIERRSQLRFLHPHRAREIRGRDKAWSLDQVAEILRRTLERDLMRRLEADDAEHLAADGERQVGAPFHVFGHARPCTTDPSDAVQVHSGILYRTDGQR